MPYDGRITSALLGAAMALSPYSMAVAGHHQPQGHEAHGKHHQPEKRPDGPGSAGCHAACLRDDKLLKRAKGQ